MPAQNLRGFAEKVALVSDAGNEIGRAVALQGCYMIAGFSNVTEENKHALTELQSLGTLANAIETDISTVEGTKRLVAEAGNLYGRLDLLINTARFKPELSLEETTENVWTRNVDVNLKSLFFVTQAAISLMKSRPKPAIVNVASACDSEDTANNIAFAAVQAGIVGMTKALAKELAPKFRVNAVAASEKKAANKFFETLDAELFKPQTGVADDLARTIVYLLSSEAVGLNGQILTVE